MLACLAALTSLLGGCVTTSNGARAAFARKPIENPERSKIVPASLEESTEEPPALIPERRSFPMQGWWCGQFDEWLSPERAARGYTIILPGVEGTSWYNISVAHGLVKGGHEAAIEIHDWTTGRWPMFVYHLMALERNKAQAQIIADKIVQYQDHYPDRPVTLIGHSGGAAMAVLVLEALPDDRKITQAVLLAAALSPDYDLSTPLARTERGITNFYSAGDVLYLMAGTLALGTLDRQHSVSAGAIGFHTPDNLTSDERVRYELKLHQEGYRPEMLWSLNLGGHMGPTGRKFVAEWVAPRLQEK